MTRYTKDNIPEWHNVSKKMNFNDTENLTHLEIFIYENEPAGDASEWRTQLANMLNEQALKGKQHGK